MSDFFVEPFLVLVLQICFANFIFGILFLIILDEHVGQISTLRPSDPQTLRPLRPLIEKCYLMGLIEKCYLW